MVKRFLKFVRSSPPVEAALAWLSGLFTGWPEEELERFATASAGISWPPGATSSKPPNAGRTWPESIAPETVEMRFMKLQAEGRFDEMWEMVAEDAQRAWGGREAFIKGMPRLGDDTELLDMQVVTVSILDSWVDHVRQRAYSNVAQMVMRYHVRQRWREWTFDRQVHLVPGAGGWRTLCYPAGVIASSAAGTR
jgi:hypothetical protein